MRKIMIVFIGTILIFMTGCKADDTVFYDTIKELDGDISYEILDEANVFVSDETHHFVFNLVTNEKTDVFGISDLEKLVHVTYEFKSYITRDENKLSFYDFDGKHKGDLEVDEGDIVIPYRGLVIVKDGSSTKRSGIRQVYLYQMKLYDMDMKLVKECIGDSKLISETGYYGDVMNQTVIAIENEGVIKNYVYDLESNNYVKIIDSSDVYVYNHFVADGKKILVLSDDSFMIYKDGTFEKIDFEKVDGFEVETYYYNAVFNGFYGGDSTLDEYFVFFDVEGKVKTVFEPKDPGEIVKAFPDEEVYIVSKLIDNQNQVKVYNFDHELLDEYSFSKTDYFTLGNSSIKAYDTSTHSLILSNAYKWYILNESGINEADHYDIGSENIVMLNDLSFIVRYYSYSKIDRALSEKIINNLGETREDQFLLYNPSNRMIQYIDFDGNVEKTLRVPSSREMEKLDLYGYERDYTLLYSPETLEYVIVPYVRVY